MKESAKRNSLCAFALALLAALLIMITTASAQTPPNVQSLGLERPDKSMDVTVTLNLRNQAQLDALVKQIHDESSPMYRKFLTKDQFAKQFAPTAADSKVVRDYLVSQGLTVTYVDKFNMVVRARGPVANLEKAFATQVGVFQAQGKEFNMPLTEPSVPAMLSTKVKNVGGLSTIQVQSHAVRQSDLATGQPLPGVPVTVGKNGVFFPSNCFGTASPVYIYGPGLQAVYSGNGYTLCGYSPAEIRHAYGFDTVINAGLDGTGQTIVVVDAYGSNTLAQDVATFDSIYGLPAINLNVIYNPTNATPSCVVSDTQKCGWEDETTLDVEWAHAMAPGATIDLVISATNSISDLANIDLWVMENIAPASASHSFGTPEGVLYASTGGPADASFQYSVNYLADQVFGISNNYSSGDSGDYFALGEATQPDVSFPAGSPNATSVGGTSLAIAADGSYTWENGWGTNLTNLMYAPPKHLGFIYGGGGGASSVTAAPDWQASFLGNLMRQQPDVAFDGDPYTGVEFIFTPSGVVGGPQYVGVIGGTSLSCPMFSAVWSIVAQAVGGNLGNAAPILYEENHLFPGSFKDVKPVSSGHNAHGTIFYNGIPTAYSQWDLAQPYENSLSFWEAIYHSPSSGRFYALTFGTDSSLTTGPGWDNVTGLGTPAGAKFIAPFISTP
jgi:subtilase family serine protease